VPGFEVPSRAPDEETNWWLEALRRGQQLEDQVSPNEWLPPSPVPNTVIIDDTDLVASPPGRILTAPIRFESPADDLTWGRLAGRPNVWNDHFEAHDPDTYAVNTNIFGAITGNAACVIDLGRVLRCAAAGASRMLGRGPVGEAKPRADVVQGEPADLQELEPGLCPLRKRHGRPWHPESLRHEGAERLVRPAVEGRRMDLHPEDTARPADGSVPWGVRYRLNGKAA
jgi:hypothetical protein